MGLPLVGSLILFLPGVQTKVVENVTERLSNDLNTEISIGRVQALPFSGIRLDDFLIRDLNQDTLLYAPRVHSEIDYFSFFKKHLYLGRVKLENPEVYLNEKEEEMNFTFLLDSLGSMQPDTAKWNYSVRGININNGSIKFSHSVLKNPTFKKDSLHFNQFNLDITRTSGINDSLNFELETLNLSEVGGLKIEGAGAKGKFRKDKISIQDFFLETKLSDLKIDLIELKPKTKNDTINNETRFLMDIRQIVLSPEELAMFFSGIPEFDRGLGLSGKISGSLKNLKGRDITATLGKNTWLQTSFDLTDLSDFRETFIFMDIKNLRTTVSDLEQIIQVSSTEAKNEIPSALQNMGIIQYSGNLTGFLKDLVAYGNFKTKLGTLSTDISLKISDDNDLGFSGFLQTEEFQVGEILNLDQNMGLTMDIEINGTRKSKTNYFAYLNGDINSLKWNGYTYKNAIVNGLFTYQRFDGSVSVNDPNGSFRFDGEIDGSGELPTFQFWADFENVMPDRLNLFPQLEDGVVTMSIGANFKGDNIDNLEGEIGVYNGLVFTPESSVEIDSLEIEAFKDEDAKQIVVSSDFIEGNLSGQYNLNRFRASFLDMVSHFLPSLAAREPRDDLPLNRFEFEFTFRKFDRLAGILFPGLEMAHFGTLKGNVDSEKQLLNIDGSIENLHYKGINAEDVEFNATTNEDNKLEIITRSRKIDRNDMFTFYNFSIHQTAGLDTLDVNVFWNNWDEITNSGAIYSSTAFKKEKNDQFSVKTHLQPSTVILEDSVWEISEAKALYTSKLVSIQGLEMSHDDQRLALNGFMHRENMDGIRLEMDNIDLSQFFDPENQSSRQFGGIADGSIELKNYYRSPLWSANFSVDKFSFDGDTIGFFVVGSQWDQEEEGLAINTSVTHENTKPLQGSGYFWPQENSVDLNLDLDGLSISFLDTFIGNILQNIEGQASGNLNLTGALNKPYLTGKINLDQGNFDVDLLQTSYELSDSVWFYPNEIRFKDMTVTDKFGETGKFGGSIYHDSFVDMVYNLQMDINDMLVLDTKLKDNPFYYGTVYGRGNLLVTGTTKNVELNIGAETTGNTRFFIPMADTEEAVQSNFIRFVTKDQKNPNVQVEKTDDPEYDIDLSGIELNMEIDVTPQARIEIIFDSAQGDLLSASGEGNIQILIDRQGNINFFGDYIIEKGEYLFSLQNLVNKKFAINKGGTVSWQGEPYNANVDLTAVYKLKASLSDLIGPMADENTTGDQSDIQRRIPIHCNLMLDGPLEKPGIKFGIEAPTLTESRESYMLDFISSEDEMNRQVLSLLVLNRFYTPDYLRMGGDQSMQTNNAALVTTTEMLSNQLSRWLSNISSDVDVGVSYRPEDNISSEEIEVALSTQMFNNRVSINGNVGYGKYQTNTSKMIGDFDMDVKLNPSGTIRAKAYTRSNDDIIYETSPTTQGIGVTFREEFDKFSELMQKYWRALTGKKNSEQEPEDSE